MFSLTRRPYIGEEDDGLGNTVPQFGADETVKVSSIAPHTVEQGSDTITQTQVADVDLYMPKTAVNVRDQFIEDGTTYEVVGVQDWTKGFHGWQAGMVVELKKVS